MSEKMPYQPTSKEIKKGGKTMTDERKWDSEKREKHLKRLDILSEVMKNKPFIYDKLMDYNTSAYIVREIAENLKTKDGLVYMTSEELDSQDKIVYGTSQPVFGGSRARIEKVQQGNLRIWQEKPKSKENGHFDKGNNPNLIANAYADVEDIREEINTLKENMELVEEENHSPKSDRVVKKSNLYVFKKKEDQGK